MKAKLDKWFPPTNLHLAGLYLDGKVTLEEFKLGMESTDPWNSYRVVCWEQYLRTVDRISRFPTRCGPKNAKETG